MRQLRLLGALLKYHWQNEFAYPGNFIASVCSTVVYTAMYVIFINLLFNRVGSIGSYSKNDMYVVYFTGQLGFFITMEIFYNGFSSMITLINTGQFDFDLLRPVNIKSWSLLKGVTPFGAVLESLPPLLMIAVFIRWSEINLSILRLAATGLIIIAGITITYTILFLFCLPAFRTGESSELLHVFWGMGPQTVPFERLPKAIKVTAFTILPSLLFGSIGSAVLLGKQGFWPYLPLAVMVGFVAWYLQRILWRYALRTYTSASS